MTRRLRRLQLVPEPMVIRTHGAMRAAAVGQSPMRWREQFRPMPPAEALAVAFSAWLLADPLDDLDEQRGQRDRFSEQVVELLLTVEPEPGGKADADPNATNEPSRMPMGWLQGTECHSRPVTGHRGLRHLDLSGRAAMPVSKLSP